MTRNERKLVLIFEAVAAACLLAVQAVALASESRALEGGERSIRAAMEAARDELAALPGLRSEAEARAFVPEGSPAVVMDAEACAETVRSVVARNGLKIARYAIVETDGGAAAVELSVSGSAYGTAAALSEADAIDGWAVSSYAVRSDRGGTQLESTFRLGKLDPARSGHEDLATVVEPEGAARLFGLAALRRAPSAPAAEPSAPEAPLRRIAYVGLVEGADGIAYYFKDLDSGRVRMLREGAPEADGWRIAGHDSGAFLVEVDGMTYKVER
ncbi:MAG: hypothetical protein JXA15_13880 [Spirochaetales bacterium]|nr:hypothetical protein [Spirochaetales bacterium]